MIIIILTGLAFMGVVSGAIALITLHLIIAEAEAGAKEVECGRPEQPAEQD